MPVVKHPGIAFIRRSGVCLDDVPNGLRRARLRCSSERRGDFIHRAGSFEQRRLGGDSIANYAGATPIRADAHFGQEETAARGWRAHVSPVRVSRTDFDAHHGTGNGAAPTFVQLFLLVRSARQRDGRRTGIIRDLIAAKPTLLEAAGTMMKSPLSLEHRRRARRRPLEHHPDRRRFDE